MRTLLGEFLSVEIEASRLADASFAVFGSRSPPQAVRFLSIWRASTSAPGPALISTAADLLT